MIKKYMRKKIAARGLLLATFCAMALAGCSSQPKKSVMTQIFLNGQEVGQVLDADSVEKIFLSARKEIAAQSDSLVYMDLDLTTASDGNLYEVTEETTKEQLLTNMKNVMQQSIVTKPKKSYTVKMNDYMVNVESKEAAQQLLQAVVDKYDEKREFQVALLQDSNRDLKVMTAKVVKNEEKENEQVGSTEELAGIGVAFWQYYNEADTLEEKGFSDYQYGTKDMDFTEQVEIVEAYLPENQVTEIGKAIEDVTKEQETKTIYKVAAGDTLSEIAIKVNIPMDQIVEMNDSLENASSTLRVDQELIITVPEPEVSVERNEVNYYEEIYDAPIVYIDRDDWYTTETHVIQQPSAGFRKIAANEYYVNDKLVERTILKEEIVMDAVEKIVERGTKIPPTYIKPISGGRQTSGFGKRKAPTKGASTYHKGIDWATPTGTAVYASCGGKVSKAGWGSGYGNVIYIDHEDGRQTRYGHLSKILVSVGDKVKQGDKIALSGNTGVSTGPHIHFEILIDGTQVNPLKYLN